MVFLKNLVLYFGVKLIVSVFVTFSCSILWKAITQNFEACIDVICLLLEYGV